MKDMRAKPFLKWAGGKTQLLKEIGTKIPYTINEEFTYIEPFVGSGAVLFSILNNYKYVRNIIINDLNTDLTITYYSIKTDIENLIFILDTWQSEYHTLSDNPGLKKDYYYEKRNLFNERTSNHTTQAALMIFLNKTCFNGLYRVNKKNGFNVPIGSYKKPKICDKDNLRIVSKALSNVTILNGDFEKTYDFIEKNTFFYFDPPYKPLNETSSFNAYAKDKFNDTEQIRLKEFCDRLDSANCRWILSNSDVKNTNPEEHFFDELFEDYQIDRVEAKRSINSNANKRGKLTELLITNHEDYFTGRYKLPYFEKL